VLQDELVWRPVHQLHEFIRFADDGRPVAPGEDGRKKTGDLDILPPVVLVRDAYRIVEDKRGAIVFGDLFVKKGLKIIGAD